MAEDETTENIVAFAVFFLIVVLAVGFWNNWWGLFSPEAAHPIKTTSIDEEPTKGSSDAPVTMVEYSDFQCPHCKRFYQQTLPAIVRRYVEAGTVRVVYKDMPLSIHEDAMSAAVAGECAYRQGKFWKMHDKLFQNQQRLSRENYVAWAEEIGLNTSEFTTCLDEPTVKAAVRQDRKDGTDIGVTSTPTFVIGPTGSNADVVEGEVIIGAQDFVTMEAAIQRARKR